MIGSAGGADKIAYRKEIGVDHTMDYKAEPNLQTAWPTQLPKASTSISTMSAATISRRRLITQSHSPGSRCAAGSQYNATMSASGPRQMMQMVGSSSRSGLYRFQPQQHAAHVRQGTGGLERGPQDKWRPTVKEGVEGAGSLPGAVHRPKHRKDAGKIKLTQPVK